MKFNKIPKDLDDAVSQLEAGLSAEDRAWIVADKDEDAFGIHHGFGQHMRNNWGLWREGTVLHDWFLAKGIFHADDSSAIITDAFRAKVQNKPFDFDARVRYYQDYWKGTKEAQDAGGTTEHEMTIGGKLVKIVTNYFKGSPKSD